MFVYPKMPVAQYEATRINAAQSRFAGALKGLTIGREINTKTESKVNTLFNKCAHSPSKQSASFHKKLNKLKLSTNVTNKIRNSWNDTAGTVFQKGSVTHNADAWKTRHNQVQNDFHANKHMLGSIYEQTKTASTSGYTVGNTTHRPNIAGIVNMQKGTYVAQSPKKLTTRGPYNTTVSVYNKDTIDLTKKLIKKGFNPVALNFANKNRPGGGAISGARAQEETLFRRTNYHLGLDTKYNPYLNKYLRGNYDIPEFGTIYTPNVQVIRKGEKKGYAFTDPTSIDFIASAAYKIKQGTSTPEEKTKSKIRAILRTAAITKHDAVVLGAYGCGAFDNKPKKMAKLFREVLLEKEFKGQFRHIAFGVIDDHNGTNYKPFHDTLNNLKI